MNNKNKDECMWEYQTLLDIMEIEDMDNPIEEIPVIPTIDPKYCSCDKPKLVRSEAMREFFWYCRTCKKEKKDE